MSYETAFSLGGVSATLWHSYISCSFLKTTLADQREFQQPGKTRWKRTTRGATQLVQMGSFCVFLYSDNRIGGDCETGLRRSGLSSHGDLTIWRVRRRTHPTWLPEEEVIQEPVGVRKLSVQAHFVLHEAPVG